MGEKKLSTYDQHSVLADDLQRDEAGFAKIADILRQATGIHLPINDKNRALMAPRLISILKQHQLNTYRDYAKFLSKGDAAAQRELVESLTTNKTDFFRESKHFDLFKRELPRLLQENATAGRRDLRIWCAAASTGQEPYTIAITLRESIQDIAQWSLKFLASDIDTQLLAKGSKGLYETRECEGLSSILQKKYFQKIEKDNREYWQANRDLKSMIRFAQFNLMTDPFPFEHKFDVVFCRNVLIYFERETAIKVVEKLSKSLRPNGLLFVGHTETGIARPDFMDALDVAAYKSVQI